MSAILAVVSAPTPRRMEPGAPEALLEAMASRGSDRREVWRGAGAAVGVGRYAWETSGAFAGRALVVHDGSLVVAADATLYGREDLARRFRSEGVAARGPSPGHQVAAAYRAWGVECAARLRGDFAFVVWDRDRRRLLASRDFAGTRTLFHGRCGSDWVVASTSDALLAHPESAGRLDLAAVASTAAGLWERPSETPYLGIEALPAGWSLVIDLDRASPEPTLRRHWSPPAFRPRSELDADRAADRLRDLIVEATAERLPPDAPAAVWMSGGWDSTAVFAAGRHGLGDEGADRLRAVSMSYPEGDPGREDELIRSVAERWDEAVTWVDIADVDMFENAWARASARQEPFAHPFESWNRELARGARATGSRVALTGSGGDQLFQVSDIYLGDLLRRGRWLTLVSDLCRRRASGGSMREDLLRWILWPNLPRRVRARWDGSRPGSMPRGYLDRTLPNWIRPEFARAEGLVERQRQPLPEAGGADLADREMLFYLTAPFFSRVAGRVFAFGLQEGVEIRSPLLDGRLVEFAARRPVSERNDGRETKRLLRRSMRGLLPERVLAPRPHKTGLTGGHFLASTRRALPALHADLAGDLCLADLGIVEPEALAGAVESYGRGGFGEGMGLRLFLTLQTEMWLRLRVLRDSVGHTAAARAADSTGESPGTRDDERFSHV